MDGFVRTPYTARFWWRRLQLQIWRNSATYLFVAAWNAGQHERSFTFSFEVAR